MYRHLLVPVDNSDLSIVIIGKAVEFAKSLGARVTFFHAQTDHASALSGNAEVVRLTSPTNIASNFEGRARELLTKAESAARAQGVPYSSATMISGEPFSAIIAAARKESCDLIFMASHGRTGLSGMLLGNQAAKVLSHSRIPVLVYK